MVKNLLNIVQSYPREYIVANHMVSCELWTKIFEEYLNDPDNKKWEEIANSGMDYTINEVNNDKGAESLVELIESFIK